MVPHTDFLFLYLCGVAERYNRIDTGLVGIIVKSLFLEQSPPLFFITDLLELLLDPFTLTLSVKLSWPCLQNTVFTFSTPD